MVRFPQLGPWHMKRFAPSQHPSPVRQDDEYLYLVMEYLPGGDVMVSALPARRMPQQYLYAVTFTLALDGSHVQAINMQWHQDSVLWQAWLVVPPPECGGADAAHAQGHPERGGDALLHRGDRARAGVHPQALLHSQVPREPAPQRGLAAEGLQFNACMKI